MTNEEMIERRVLAALRALQIQKRADVLAMVEGMARAFPLAALPAKLRPSLSLVVSARQVVSSGQVINVRQRLGHDKKGILPAVSLGAVSAK